MFVAAFAHACHNGYKVRGLARHSALGTKQHFLWPLRRGELWQLIRDNAKMFHEMMPLKKILGHKNVKYSHGFKVL